MIRSFLFLFVVMMRWPGMGDLGHLMFTLKASEEDLRISWSFGRWTNHKKHQQVLVGWLMWLTPWLRFRSTFKATKMKEKGPPQNLSAKHFFMFLFSRMAFYLYFRIPQGVGHKFSPSSQRPRYVVWKHSSNTRLDLYPWNLQKENILFWPVGLGMVDRSSVAFTSDRPGRMNRARLPWRCVRGPSWRGGSRSWRLESWGCKSKPPCGLGHVWSTLVRLKLDVHPRCFDRSSCAWSNELSESGQL